MELNAPLPSSQDTDSHSSQHPTPSQPLASSTSLPEPSTEDDLFAHIASFDPTADLDFLLGLSDILNQPGALPTPAQLQANNDLVLQATCFYLSRKWNLSTPVDPTKFHTWLQINRPDKLPPSTPVTANTTTSPPPPASVPSRPSAPTPNTASAASTLPVQPRDQSIQTQQDQPQPQSQSTSQTEPAPPPPYPTSFAEIVDLITQNKPIPGIEEIPTTVLDLGSSKQDTATRRRKPWEKDPPNSTAGEGSATATAVEDGLANSIDVDEHKRSGEGVMKILQPNAVPDSGLIAKE